MLPIRRIIGGRQVLGYVHDSFVPSPIYHQTFRWVRKPRWLPMAKSKVFRIPKKKEIPEDQEKEFFKLVRNYKTYMNSLRKVCVQLVEKNKVVTDEAFIQNLEDDDYEACMKMNDEWNKKIAETREERRKIEKEDRFKEIMQRIQEIDLKTQQEQDAMNVKIRMAKEQSHTFISEKNIDQAIEEALNTVVNYDKVLDLQGNLYEVQPTTPKQASV